jgi:RecJ-like exonuclease
MNICPVCLGCGHIPGEFEECGYCHGTGYGCHDEDNTNEHEIEDALERGDIGKWKNPTT